MDCNCSFTFALCTLFHHKLGFFAVNFDSNGFLVFGIRVIGSTCLLCFVVPGHEFGWVWSCCLIAAQFFFFFLLIVWIVCCMESLSFIEIYMITVVIYDCWSCCMDCFFFFFFFFLLTERNNHEFG